MDTYIGPLGQTLVGDPYRVNATLEYAWGGDDDYTLVSYVMSGGMERIRLPDGSWFWGVGRTNLLTTTNGFINPDKGHFGDVSALCDALGAN